MPAFRDGDFTIVDSTAIVTYLDAQYPEPNLIPVVDELADTLMMAAGGAIFGNRFVKPRVMKLPCHHEAVDHAENALLPPIFEYLERTIPDSGFLVEDRLTLADISVVSPLATLGCIGVCVDAGRYPRTAAYVDAIHARPSFAEIIARDRAQVAAMGGVVAAA